MRFAAEQELVSQGLSIGRCEALFLMRLFLGCFYFATVDGLLHRR